MNLKNDFQITYSKVLQKSIFGIQKIMGMTVGCIEVQIDCTNSMS